MFKKIYTVNVWRVLSTAYRLPSNFLMLFLKIYDREQLPVIVTNFDPRIIWDINLMDQIKILIFF